MYMCIYTCILNYDCHHMYEFARLFLVIFCQTTDHDSILYLKVHFSVQLVQTYMFIDITEIFK